MLRKIAVVVTGSALTMAVAGCSTADGNGDGDPSADQSSASPSAGSASAAQAEGDQSAATEAVAEAVSRVADATSYRFKMTSSGEASGESAQPEGDFSQEIVYTSNPEPIYKMNVPVTPETTTLGVIRGDELLVQGDPSIGMPPWMRMEVPPEVQKQLQLDPLALIRQLLASEDVEKVGSEEVNGVATTKYEGSYAVEAALEQVQDEQARQSIRSLYEEEGATEVDFQVWVDADGLPRRVGDKAGDSAGVEFLEFNQPVDVPSPAPDEIQDIDGLMGNPNAQ
ncbi:LolA-like protein [Salinactinospora qingdaonensis]|uniref:Lipoprotein LprG n=1 Tax=Salinactinospora qingdaonensis TaxID=702744 RepID=A0ABP7G2D8_9ACTN